MSVKKAFKDMKRRKRKAQRASVHHHDKSEFAMSNYGDIWFGFKTELDSILHTQMNPTSVCMVAVVDAKSIPPFEFYYPNRFSLGDWYVTNGPFGNPDLAGPFLSVEEAKDFGQRNLGSTVYKPAIGMNYGG